jgi:aspartate/methionine/tyrosine aminotransferase
MPVTEIDLTNIVNQIDFNSKELQVYAPNLGIESLRKSIIKEYFPSYQTFEGFENNIAITPGGMPGLELSNSIIKC